MNIALCAIGRRENQYALEFIEHYIKLGVSKFYIYDNNYDGEERFEDVLQYYIDNDIVEIIDFRNKQCCQLAAYNDCYSKHGDSHDWIAFFDFDEFLVLEKHKDISDFLKDKNDFDAVLINWMVMTDNGLVHNDRRPLMERFTESMEKDRPVGSYVSENRLVKSIIHGGLKNKSFSGNPHVMWGTRCCNSNGVLCKTHYWQDINWDVAYLKHFTTKTIEEFMTRKIKVGTPDRPFTRFINDYKNVFFKINEKTPEKESYIESLNH